VARISAPACPRPRSARDALAARLSLVGPPLLPELALYRAGPQSGLARRGGRPPYWAYFWGGGLALARFVLDHPETVAGQSVVDLGAGSGLVAISAMKAGAAEALAIDVDPDALGVIALNAAANAVAVAAVAADPLDGPPPAADLVLVGDLFYGPALATRATAFLDRCVAAGLGVLVGDPWRAHLPLARLMRLAEYRLADFGDGPGAATAAAVFAFV